MPEELLRRVNIIYGNPYTKGRSVALHAFVSIHRESALSPPLFAVVMDTVTRYKQRPVSYTLPCIAHDVFLVSQNKGKNCLMQHRLNLNKRDF